jgi:hypothetical protein
MCNGERRVQDWTILQNDLMRLGQQQLFFIGGAPRSGTTWLQQMLDAHPDINCRGEGLLHQHLAAPLAKIMSERRAALAAKNAGLFRHTGGFLPPSPDDDAALLRMAVLLELRRQCGGGSYKAVGEKTPENVFFFPELKALFPQAKFIGIARDPRDVLTSAWHFFRGGSDDGAAKSDFIRLALPSLESGARAMLALVEANPADCVAVTYESLLQAPAPVLSHLCRFLGVTDDGVIVADCVARTRFAVSTGGRAAGVAQDRAFLRKGVSGDWTATLTPAMNAMVLDQLGWMYPRFGWTV